MKLPSGRQVRLHEGSRPSRLTVKQTDPHSENQVETPITERQRLKFASPKFRHTAVDMNGVPLPGCLDHFFRAVDGEIAAAVQPVTDKAGSDTMSAADFEHPVGRTDVQTVDDALKPVHDGRQLPSGQRSRMTCFV
jgi:hypothetical protein